jgi:hypothetical protein
VVIRKKKAGITNLGLLCFGVIICFLVPEAALRLYYGRFYKIRYNIPDDENIEPLGGKFDDALFWNKETEKIINKIARQKELPAQEKSLFEFDPLLGWDIQPGAHTFRGTSYNINSQNIRADREFSLKPGQGIKRAVFVGDSFTLGFDAGDDDCWVSRLDRRLGEKVEILNMGVGAYGSDQAFLKWKAKGLKFNTHVAVLGILLENVFRNVNLFRPFYLPGAREALPKPRFIIDEEGKLEAINYPVVPLEKLKQTFSNFSDSPLRKHEYFYDRFFFDNGIWRNFYLFRFISSRIKQKRRTYEYAFKPGSEPYEVTVAIADAFHKEALTNNVDPYIIIIPDGENLSAYKENFFWKDFLDELARRKIKYLDLSSGLYKERKKKIYGEYSHFNTTGNEIVAEAAYRFFIKEKTFQTNTHH